MPQPLPLHVYEEYMAGRSPMSAHDRYFAEMMDIAESAAETLAVLRYDPVTDRIEFFIKPDAAFYEDAAEGRLSVYRSRDTNEVVGGVIADIRGLTRRASMTDTLTDESFPNIPGQTVRLPRQ